MKTVAELIALIEQRHPVGESTTIWLSVTGEPYVVIGSQHPGDGLPTIPGTIDEGRRGEYAADEETALWQARAAFEQYAEGRLGTLYWRSRPTETESWFDAHGSKYHGVYLRMLISDKPVMRGSAS